MAWVGFAVLLLILGGGLAGLYTHRQNQEAAKLRLLGELRRDVDKLEEDTGVLTREFKGWVMAPSLKLAVRDRQLALVAITPERRILVPAASAPAAPAASVETAAPAAVGSVMAVVTRP